MAYLNKYKLRAKKIIFVLLAHRLGILSAVGCSYLSVFHYDFIDGLVEHVGSAVDGGEAGKPLRQLPQAVQRVQVGRLSCTLT